MECKTNCNVITGFVKNNNIKQFGGIKVKRLITILGSILLLTVFLTACGNSGNTNKNEGNNNQPQGAENGNNQAGDSEERTLVDGLGNEVTIPANPQRVIASYLEDHLVALDIKPVAQWTVNDGASTQEYLAEYLQGIELIPYDLPFEAVMSFDPDLIIIGSPDTVEGGKYEQYSKIAPTYVLNNEQAGDWRKVLTIIGEIFGKEEQAKKVLAEYDEKVSTAKNEIKETVGEQSAAAIWVVNNSVFMVNETSSSGAVMYGDLGLTVPSLVKEVSESATSDWSQVSLEKLAELDADHLFLINSESGTEFFEDVLWKNIPAVKNDNLHEFAPTTGWLYNGTIASEQIVNHILDSILK